MPTTCRCKVGSCRHCDSACRRCGCGCDGVAPDVALRRARGGRHTVRKRSRSNAASSQIDQHSPYVYGGGPSNEAERRRFADPSRRRRAMLTHFGLDTRKVGKKLPSRAVLDGSADTCSAKARSYVGYLTTNILRQVCDILWPSDSESLLRDVQRRLHREHDGVHSVEVEARPSATATINDFLSKCAKGSLERRTCAALAVATQRSQGPVKGCSYTRALNDIEMLATHGRLQTVVHGRVRFNEDKATRLVAAEGTHIVKKRGRKSVVPDDVADYMSELLLDNATLKPAQAVSRVRERFPSIPDNVTDKKLKNKFNITIP